MMALNWLGIRVYLEGSIQFTQRNGHLGSFGVDAVFLLFRAGSQNVSGYRTDLIPMF